jgi:hypothetical protein
VSEDVIASPDDPAARRQLAAAIHAEALAALSVTRDQTLEITSAAQLRICEQAARRILELRVDDEELNASAMAMLREVAAGRRWAWVNQVSVVVLSILAVAVGIGAAVLGALLDSFAIAAVGAVVSSATLAGIVLRYRREQWRIRAEEIDALISKPGV